VGCPDANFFAAYFDLQLASEDVDRLFSHVDTCPDCARLFAATAAAQATRDYSSQIDPSGDTVADEGRGRKRREPAIVSTLGRYRVERIVGMGGMGVVYAAHDPQLDRKVAVKLLRPDSRAAADSLRARLGLEAQAMARLSHPNVINVYEIGTHGEQVFVVMELIDGTTLAEWLRAKDRSWREIVGAFVAAGAGLEAAHAAGVVHRDFKPDNVLISRDGRVCVTDFGLARISKRDGEPGSPGASPVFGTTVTYSGRLVGTPAYMAPEQMRGEPTDARSDLFSFCASLYEALYGTRPYLGEDLAALRAAVEAGRLQPPKRAVGPGEYRAAIERGLRPNPDERQASIGGLLSVLRRDPIARRRRWLAGAAAALLVVAVAIGFYRMRRRTLVCVGSEARLAGIWEGARKDQIHGAFAATGAPYAEAVWRTVDKTVDRYVNDWLAMRTEACESTRLRGTQSEELLDLRMSCLDEGLAALKAQGDAFAAADKKTVENAVSASNALPPLARCADGNELRAPARPPADPATRARIAAVETRIAAARAAEATGHYRDGLATNKDLVDVARAIAYRPLEADALLITGKLHYRDGDHAAASSGLLDAALAAEAGGSDVQVANCWIALALSQGDLAQYDQARVTLRQADSRIERHHDRALAAELASARGQIDYQQGRYADAEKNFREALAISESVYGPNHLKVGGSLMQLGAAEGDLAKYEQALEHERRSLAIREQALGPDHPAVASALNNLATVMIANDQLNEALALLTRALDILRRALGADNPGLTNELQNIALVLGSLNRPAEALSYQEEALRIVEKARGPDHPATGWAHHNLGGVLDKLGRLDEALAHERKALEIFSAKLGPNHPFVSHPLVEMGSILNDRHRATEALPLLERAEALCQANPSEPNHSALVAWELARALWALHRDESRARELALSARKVLAALPKRYGDEVRKIDRELARH
jgi:tetratricopeptide (TPR) repeat protein/predicted Ser/Thr protein kinase